MSWRAKGGIKRWAADQWFSKCVRLSAPNGLCIACQRKPPTDCAHIIGRAVMSTRWCKANALPLCRGCHDHYGSQPLEFAELVDAIDPKRREFLAVKRRGILKNNEATRKLISDHYREQYYRMERTGDLTFESWN